MVNEVKPGRREESKRINQKRTSQQSRKEQYNKAIHTVDDVREVMAIPSGEEGMRTSSTSSTLIEEERLKELEKKDRESSPSPIWKGVYQNIDLSADEELD